MAELDKEIKDSIVTVVQGTLPKESRFEPYLKGVTVDDLVIKVVRSGVYSVKSSIQARRKTITLSPKAFFAHTPPLLLDVANAKILVDGKRYLIPSHILTGGDFQKLNLN